MRINRPILAVAAALALALASVPSKAQSVVSPYSKYGYGLLSDHATSMQSSMGTVGYAMNSGRQINVMNPASYAAIDSLTFLFDMGMTTSMLWTREGEKFGRDFSGSLDYITMQVPLTKWLSASAGLLPYSSVGYQFANEILNGSNERIGSGGLNEIYIGLGGKVISNLFVGANISYMWGDITNSSYAYVSSSNYSVFQHILEVRDYNLNFGIQYNLPIGSKTEFTLGATYSPAKDLRGHTYATEYQFSGNTQEADTTEFSTLKGRYSQPSTFGVGLAYKWNRRLLAEVDFTYQNWKDAKFHSPEGWDKTTFDNRWKVALGLQYEPNPRGSYLQRIQYRAGAYFNHDYIVVKGNNVREYGLTAGLGFPVPGFKTVINLGFEYKHRQAHPNPLLKEQYFNIKLGINFNELWFWRNKLR